MLYQIKVKLWNLLASFYPAYLRCCFGMEIGKNVMISYKARLDKTVNPKGIHIGDYTWVLAGAYILAHDHCRKIKKDTFIGSNCVIGINSIIMPGVVVGNQVVVGGGVWLQKIFKIIVL